MENISLNDFRDKIYIKQVDIKSLAALIIKDEKLMTAVPAGCTV